MMVKEKYCDPFLDKRLANYDIWLDKGEISSSSKVIPVLESLNAKQWVLPTEQVMEILTNASSIAVQDCECRTHYKRCDKPLEVCFLLNTVGDKFVSKGKARRVNLAEATSILKKANQNGLVHLALYMPDHEVFALCSCCSCCCHELQIVKLTQRRELMVHSEYVAVTDPDDCTHCGKCVDRCVFDARLFGDKKMKYDSGACLGCGLCVTACPADATGMILRKPTTESAALMKEGDQNVQ
ncbi:MAG: 4Fe-4S binding protein [Geopsychrobacter sp.]|nr:4Fe-4S binding protein [Geopsychrobacter sp.]